MPANTEQMSTSARATEQLDGKILNCLIVILGFGLCRGWIVFCLAAPFGQEVHYMTNWVYLICGAAVALLVFFMVQHFGLKTTQMLRLLYLATAVTLVLSAVLIPLAITYHLEPLLLCGFIIGGAGAGLLQVLWGDRFAYYQTSFATIVAPAAAIVTALLVASVSIGSSIVGYVVFPLVSFVLLLLIAKRTNIDLSLLIRGSAANISASQSADAVQTGNAPQEAAGADTAANQAQKDPAQADDKSKRKPIGRGVGKLLFSIMVFSFLCRTFDSAPRNGLDPFAFVGGSALMSLIIVGAVFLIFVALLKDRFNPSMTYRLSLPIMVAGFVALALLFETHAALSILLINIGYEFFDILVWILFVDIARRKDEQPLRIFGLCVAFMFVGMVLGIVCGEILHIFILNGTIQITAIALVSILSLVVVAFLVIPEGTVQHLARAVSSDKGEGKQGDKNDAAESNKASSEGRRECSCAVVATEFKLTPREHEVLILLAYGRTLTIISRDLQIAKGTARTHIENIYRKLDVHKQQELIDLVEDYEEQD